MKMPINPVAQSDAAQITSQAAAVAANQIQPAAQESAQPKPQPIIDTVQISSSAKAVMQEAQETAAQTAEEAGRGDRQAQRLLAKEAAAKAEQQGSNCSPLHS
jgi:hypothetical protein